MWIQKSQDKKYNNIRNVKTYLCGPQDQLAPEGLELQAPQGHQMVLADQASLFDLNNEKKKINATSLPLEISNPKFKSVLNYYFYIYLLSLFFLGFLEYP